MNSPPNEERLRIAQVAPIWTSLPVQGYGGRERNIGLLTDELVRRGHDVTLFTTGDSQSTAKLKFVCEQSLNRLMGEHRAWDETPYRIAHISEAVHASAGFDVMHFHLGVSTLPFPVAQSCAALHTLFTALNVDDQWMVEHYPEAHLHALTRNQVFKLPESIQNRFNIVHNGCDFSKYQLADGPKQHLVFLGRMGEHKGPVEAIEVARRVGLPIRLAGMPVNDEEQQYFDTLVRPLIDGQLVEHVGSVTDEQKSDLFRNAVALVFPIKWEEPFGNVLIEAMACGVPVLATKRGSVTEIVDPGVTGFWGENPQELAERVPAALELDRSTVRLRAMERFSFQRMTDRFLDVYARIRAHCQVGTDK